MIFPRYIEILYLFTFNMHNICEYAKTIVFFIHAVKLKITISKIDISEIP